MNKVTIKTSLDDLAKTAHTAARAFKNFAWAVFQLKYGFPREFSDN